VFNEKRWLAFGLVKSFALNEFQEMNDEFLPTGP